MRRTATMLAATTTFMLGGMLTSQAQMERGPAALADTAQNFTAIEKAACGPTTGSIAALPSQNLRSVAVLMRALLTPVL